MFELARAGRRFALRMTRWSCHPALHSLLLPETALWVSRFILYKQAGLIDTPFSLAAPGLLGTSPLYMLIFYWTFRRVPNETW